MSNKKIFMGIDIGTNYNGWAVSDEYYNIINKNGKELWGVYSFEEAQTQSKRRIKRSTVNRLNRTKERIRLLQSLFENELYDVDPLFFDKLRTSFCKLEDKGNNLKYNLFNEKNFNDKNYYDQFPTIYHLRKYILETDEKIDIRLLYLAIHHIIKYRGHFTLENQTFNIENIDFLGVFNKINSYLAENDIATEFNLENVTNNALYESLVSPKGIAKRKEVIANLFNTKDKILLSIISLFCGGTAKLADIFIDIDIESLDEFKKLSFRDSVYEENKDKLYMILGDKFELIELIKQIYDFIVMKSLLGNNDNYFISVAMVNRYNKHQKDLTKLKSYLYNNKKLYNRIFRDTSVSNNYPNYIGSNITNNHKETLKHVSVDNFYAFLIKELDLKNAKDEYLIEVYNDILGGNYLPRLNSKDNAVFPYQINEIELKEILNKQSKYYPFLLESDTYGTVLEKILSLLTFRVPYYVGHLNNKSKNSWVVRSNDKIFPWNFDDVVDRDQTAIKFIRRMTNYCSYLYDQETLPINSLIYMKYVLLNEINKININGNPICYSDKIELINELFLKFKKVNVKQVLNFFKLKYGNNVLITTSNDKGILEINGTLSSYIIFKNIFKDKFEKMFDTIENIISEVTIFEDKNILFNRLLNVYGLTKEEANQIKGLNFKGFGRLSRKLLCGIKTEIIDELGEIKEKSILDLMEETNDNFMEILYNTKYSFKNQIDEYNISDDVINYNYINSLPTSPANKRSLWSTIKIINEVEQIIKGPIDKFFIECTRNKENNNDIKNSRKKQLLDNYNTVKSTLKSIDLLSKNEFEELCQELDNTDNKKMRSKKLFLYFSQLGKSMYTGNPIAIDRLFTNDYDIDHIIPRSVVKDDSMENLVLVESKSNKDKANVYPIPSTVVSDKARMLWTYLKNNELMTAKKYNKLIRKENLTDDELVGFVNRQLVFTNQIVKILVDLLKIRNPKCEIVWSKSSNVSEFREKIDFLKCREANNLHHAHDAYFNIIVGNVFNTKYGYAMNIEKFKQYKERNITMNTDKIYDYNVVGKNGYTAWDVNHTKDTIFKQLNHTYIPVIHKETTNSGKFYKETIYSPKDGQKLIPLKGKGILSDTSKYGGYSNVEFSHYVIIKYLQKGKEKFKLVAIPVMIAKDKKAIDKYIIEESGVTNPIVVLNHLRKNSIIRIDGFEYRIRGEKDRSSNVETYWNQEQIKYIRNILKISELTLNDEIEQYDLINKIKNLKFYNDIIDKFSKKPFNKCSTLQLLITHMKNNINNFENLSLCNQCKILKNIIIIQQTQPSRASLELIGGPKDFGRISMSVNLTPGTKIISRSITGFYEKVVFEI